MNAETLVQHAIQVRLMAYAPYSHYFVGAAVLTKDGEIITGCNVENASYGATICAERVALTRAVAEGKRDFVAMAVATRDGGTLCGICRQVMAESENRSGKPIRIIIGGERITQVMESVSSLLPFSFDNLPER